MEKLNISHFVEHTKMLGPYSRSALWVSGCCFSCQGCVAQEMNQDKPSIVDVGYLSRIFLEIRGTEGITISGGEPFLQAEGLCELIKRIQKERDYGVIVYTGFTLQELIEGGDCNQLELLKYVDILIDGRYILSQDDGRAYRGSSNQIIRQLSRRYQDVFGSYYKNDKKRNIEINVTETNVYMVGVPSKYGLETWRKFKRKAGCRDG